MKRTNILVVLFVAVFLLSIAPRTSAILITQNESFGPTVTGFTVLNPLAFDKFDPALGRLDSVTFSIRATLTTTGTVTNTSGSAQNVTLGGFSNAHVTLPFGLPEASLAPSFALPSVNLGIGETWSFSGTGTRLATSSFVAPATLASFTGSDQFFIPKVRGDSGLFWKPIAVSPTSTGQIGFDVTVAYNYTVVPEPSTWVFGVALCMSALVTFCRRIAAFQVWPLALALGVPALVRYAGAKRCSHLDAVGCK